MCGIISWLSAKWTIGARRPTIPGIETAPQLRRSTVTSHLNDAEIVPGIGIGAPGIATEAAVAAEAIQRAGKLIGTEARAVVVVTAEAQAEDAIDRAGLARHAATTVHLDIILRGVGTTGEVAQTAGHVRGPVAQVHEKTERHRPHLHLRSNQKTNLNIQISTAEQSSMT